ncbi:hypothetical protein FJV76_13850 [Mesorhizobium sp. WSM4303]|uniref:hypothetical protein n=1 Tax=unclassified Mesorhizobium TaxID=325217 RepID=UPI00115E36F9|nr:MULTISPECIES: hypothetical protein [unclassified Mesorhizobium]TRC98374.1 hypothetical protein FJV77_07960 [Mesorhizobium sp. WSM4306]TRD04350.1 hypothetical protein FJV76_13850 [Mesorhizobium sp. WSM4303]
MHRLQAEPDILAFWNELNGKKARLVWLETELANYPSGKVRVALGWQFENQLTDRAPHETL